MMRGAVIGADKPLPFRGGVGVGHVRESRGLTAPTPHPSPEEEGN